MRNLFFIALFFLSLQTIVGQHELQRANTYFERAFYSDAIPLYEKVLPGNKNPEILKRLADCYYHTFNMNAAARWYTTLVSRYGNTIDASYHFKLNQSLKAIGKYNEAQQALIDYYSRLGDATMLKKINADHKYLENVSAIGNRFEIENLALNTTASEFGAIKIDSNLVYTAARKKNAGVPKLYRWNNQNYLDIYIHPSNKINTSDSLSTSISDAINTKMHEGTFAITKDRKTLYFTRNNYKNGKKKEDKDKITNLKIYRAEWSGSTWKNITELHFNSDDFSTEHPSLNHDETRLYFSSDRPGGHGSFDLYSVSILPNGQYGNPINLGGTVNTDKKEQFPFLDAANNLYFASNGHPGYGLLDIFIAKHHNGIFEKPDNIGLPINSGYDDFSLSLNQNQKQGFFASNRPDGKGSDDIYTFKETKPLVIEDCKQSISGILTDETTKLPISQGIIRLIDAQGELIKEIITSEDASYNFEISCEAIYTIEGSKTAYQDNSRIISTNKERKKEYDGSLELLSQQEIGKQKQLAAQKKKEQELIEAQRQKERELAEAQKAKARSEKEKQERIKNAIKNESAIVKEKNRTIIKTEEIHFDYSLWYLRRESRERLGVVIKTMMDNPGIVVEIGTHTDIRGNERYNRELSQKRADSAKEYLVGKGIAAERIIAKGYGESQPIVVCASEEACTEEDHEWNRRCEFVIVKWQ